MFWPVGSPQQAPMRLDDLSSDVEPQSDTRYRALARCNPTIETLEEALLF